MCLAVCPAPQCSGCVHRDLPQMSTVSQYGAYLRSQGLIKSLDTFLGAHWPTLFLLLADCCFVCLDPRCTFLVSMRIQFTSQFLNIPKFYLSVSSSVVVWAQWLWFDLLRGQGWNLEYCFHSIFFMVVFKTCKMLCFGMFLNVFMGELYCESMNWSVLCLLFSIFG